MLLQKYFGKKKMKIVIDYNGSTAICKLSGCVPTASNPSLNPHKEYNLNEVDSFTKSQVLNAFRTIEKQHEREHKL